MTERQPRSRTGLIAALSFAVLGLVITILVLVGSPPSPVFQTKLRKSQLVSEMRVDFHAAVQAGKGSVLADTDDASVELAEEARRRLEAADAARRELERLVAQSHVREEAALLMELAVAWETLQRIDAELLPLAVQNTNLKAQRLSYGPGAEAAERLQTALASLVEPQAPCDRGREVARWAFRAAAAAGRIQALQAPHIAESSDEQMDAIEATMDTCHGQLVEALARLEEIVDAVARPTLAEARAAAETLWEVNLQIILLSRQNTNVRSLALSMGRKRVVTAQCEDILEALQTAVDRPIFAATR